MTITLTLSSAGTVVYTATIDDEAPDLPLWTIASLLKQRLNREPLPPWDDAVIHVTTDAGAV